MNTKISVNELSIVVDTLNEDLDGLRVQLEQMTELARLEDRQETYLYKNMLKTVQRDLDMVLKLYG